jgi:hypothetical protein
MCGSHATNVSNRKNVSQGRLGMVGILASQHLYTKRLILATVASQVRLQAMVSLDSARHAADDQRWT